MRKRFLTLLFALLMCISMTITVYAAPQTDQSQSQTQFTTNATPAELSIIKTLFCAQDYAELYPDVVEAYGNEEAALWNHFVNHGLSEGRSLSKTFMYLHIVPHMRTFKRHLVIILSLIISIMPLTECRKTDPLQQFPRL